MATELDRVGNFQVRCMEYTLAEFDSGAVSLHMTCRVLAAWDEESKSWTNWVSADDGTEYDEITVEAMVNLIKKRNEDGTKGAINEKQVDALIEHCGWNASLSSLANREFQPKDFQLKVEEETYKGKKRYKGAWINAFDATPGGGSLAGVAADAAQRLQDEWGPSLRALAAKAKDKAQKPGGKPTLPPKTKTAPPVTAGANSTGGDVPF